MTVLLALALLLAQPLKQSTILLNCPLGSAAGTGDDNFTCSGGESLTFTRSSPSIACPRTALENTAVWEEATNTGCFIDGYGLHMYQGLTNSAIRSEAFDNASWVDVGTPVRAAGVGDSPLNDTDADTLADSIEDNDGAGQEGVGQVYATNTTSLQSVSVWARVASGTLAWSLCVLTGTDTCNTGNGCCVNQSATTTWTRLDQTATTGATSQTKAMRVVIGNDGTGATTGVLWLWGAQAVTEARTATANIPYCRSTGASATACAADTATVTVDNFPWLEGAITIDTRPYWNALSDTQTSNQLAWFDARDAGNNNRRAVVFVVSDDNTYFTNVSNGGATTNINAAITWAQGTANTLFAAWGLSNRSFGQNFTVSVRAADTNAPSAAPTTVSLGNGISSRLEAAISNVRFYRLPQTYMR